MFINNKAICEKVIQIKTTSKPTLKEELTKQLTNEGVMPEFGTLPCLDQVLYHIWINLNSHKRAIFEQTINSCGKILFEF